MRTNGRGAWAGLPAGRMGQGGRGTRYWCEIVALPSELLASTAMLALEGNARR